MSVTDRRLHLAHHNSGLSVKAIRKSYKKRVVIRDVSLDMEQGEVVALSPASSTPRAGRC